MIRIYKDNDVKVVTQGAYNTFYKPLGYNIVLEQKNQEEHNIIKKDKEDVKDIHTNKVVVEDQSEIVTRRKKSSFIKKNKKED